MARRRSCTAIEEQRTAYLFVAPFFVVFLVFFAGPLVVSVGLAFTDWNGLLAPRWVGLRNWIRLASDTRFMTALGHTVGFVAVYNILMIPLAVILALLLNISWLKGRGLWGAVLFAPVTVSLPVVAVVFDILLAKHGALNLLLRSVGLAQAPAWLENGTTALGAIVVMRIWRATGYYSAIVLSGLQALPSDVFDAAALDGASWWQTQRYVTLPLLRPILLFVLVMSSIWSFQLFEEPWILLRGGPNDATLTLVQYLYQQGFEFFRMGYASTAAVTLAAMIGVMTVLQFWAMHERWE